MSIPHYVKAAIRILHHLIEGKQIVSYEGIKQSIHGLYDQNHGACHLVSVGVSFKV